MRDTLLSNIIILNYERTYNSETSVVAIVNNNGILLAIYKFKSKRIFEANGFCVDYYHGDIQSNLCFATTIEMRNSGAFNLANRPGGAAWLFAAWLFMHQLLQWNCNEDHMACGEFDIAEFSYELFQLAKSGIMSPLEISVALMHALRLTRDRSWIMPTQCTTILAQILRMTSTTRSTWARREPLLFKLGDVSCAPSSIRKRQGLRICRSQGS